MNETSDYAELSRDDLVARLRELERAESEQTRLLHDLEVHQTELELQNRELRDVQAELEASRSRYADLFDFAPMGHLVLDGMGRMRQINLSAAAMLGRERNHLEGRLLSGFLLPPSRKRLRELLRHPIDGGRAPRTELQVNDGKDILTLSVQCRDCTDPDEGQRRLHLGLLDVSAERRAETLLALVTDTVPLLISYVDREQRYRLVNAGYEHWFGRPREQLLGRTVSEVLGEQTYRQVSAHMDRALSGQRQSYQAWMRFPDGNRRHLTIAYIPHRNDAGQVLGFVVVVRDTTEREEADEALRRSETSFRLLVEQSPDGIFLANAAGRYLDVNPAGARMLGYGREEILSMAIDDLIQPEEVARIPEEVARLAAGSVVTSEWRFRRKDGSAFPGEVVGRQLPDGRLQAVLRDISERRQAEQALRDSESFHRQTLESIPGMVFTTRPDGWCDYHSQQWVDYTGAPLSEHLGYGWNRLLHPEDAPRSLKAWRAAVAGRAPYGLEYRVRRHDGSYEWFRVIGRPIRDGLGAIARWFGVAMNIDVLKRTEQTLQQRTRELEALLDTIPAMVCVKDASLRNIRVNRAFAEEFGLDRAHIEGRSDAQLLPPELARISLESDRRVMRDGCSLEAEEQSWLDGNGRRRWVATSKTPIFGDDDRATGLVGVSMDITESKLAEAERLAAMERQRDTLVREVHHRIKNHLQGVIGLLDNQAEDHPEVADPLRDTIAQVRTIAQVYGLQSRRNDARVSLRELIDVAANSAAEKVQCRLQDVGKTELAQAEAVPVALVVNELITNALKHRKSTGRPVQVALEKLPEGMRIRIRGGPSQLPAAFDFTTGRGLGTGLELIRLLLPPHGAKLCMRQDDEEVVAELWLSPPVLQP